MSLQRYLFELTQFELNLEDEIRKIVKANEKKIVRLVRDRLYNTGRDGTGQLITPPYTASTQARKREEKKRFNFVTLRDTGLFYKGFYVDLQGYTLLFDSSDGKTASLVEKYGEEILHFTDQEKNIIFDTIIEPGLNKLVANLDFNASSAGVIDLDTF